MTTRWATGLHWLILATGSVLAAPGSAHAEVPMGYRTVAAEYDVPFGVFYAVALTESGTQVDTNGSIRPWPWTLNVAGNGRFYPTRKAAADALAFLLGSGRESVDIGLMQVNWRYHRERLGSPQRALDPYHNLRVAAEILRDCHQSRQDWWEAVGCYHAPNSPHRAARYRARVFEHWQRVTERG